MPERISFIPNPAGGRDVLLIDLSGFTTAADALPTIAEVRNVIARQPLASTRCLVDVTGSKFNSEVVDALKIVVAANRPHVIASALIGVSGLMRIILDGLLAFSGRSNLKAFPSRDDAMAWLAAREQATAA